MRVDPTTPVWPDSPRVDFARARSIERGDSNNVTHMALDVHTGTHVDAPSHFFDDGKTIDLVGLTPFVGPAVVVSTGDARDLTVDVLESAGLPADAQRLLLKTANSTHPPSSEFRRDFTAITPEAADWLVQNFELRSLGIDYLSVQPYFASDEVHTILLSAGIGLIEGLDLRGVDPGDYELLCLPLKLVGVEAAPARALLRAIPGAKDG
jgi:arylformamidase